MSNAMQNDATSESEPERQIRHHRVLFFVVIGIIGANIPSDKASEELNVDPNG